ncbi:MAG: DUF3306 domain-containing protein [Gammaproteobacteria bacterium]|nr:MAG: DUF3306 domain-containing protein [Gammaproteobacteria bacterium]
MGRENKSGEPAVDDQESFLARWSRRKLDTQVDAADAPENESAAVTPPELPATAAEKELTDADMPPIETLDENSDFSPFLSPGVSDNMRHQALRKLFSQPAYNVTDGLNDYDEDFTQFASLGKLVTREMKRRMQRELEAEKRRAESPDVQTRQTAGDAVPADDVTAAAETGNTECDETTAQNNETDKGDVPSG